MAHRVIRQFGAYFNFMPGEIREFTEAEALRYAAMIEPVKRESGGFLDRSITKGKKKGRK